jgi:stage V sporulation protein G
MQITEIKITPADPIERPLLAYCSLTLDHCFAIHDLKILSKGERQFVAMPCRKRTYACPFCRRKNSLQAKFCNNCGKDLRVTSRHSTDEQRVYFDVAHPVTPAFRAELERLILEKYATHQRNP